jgi:ferredoxin
MEAIQLVGTFEKPLYIDLTEHLCAHSRANQIGCSKCLNICPTAAITPEEEHVKIDPLICAGCGACAALCPSGAISYSYPSPGSMFQRVQRLAETYLAQGGREPSLLVHDLEHGAELISLSARYGDGLPARMIPLDLEHVTGFGHAEMLSALACGFIRVTILAGRGTELSVIADELALANAIAGKDVVQLISTNDIEELARLLAAKEPKAHTASPIMPIGNRREITKLAAQTLNPDEIETISLPKGAPYGAVNVNKDSCTLCLSCVSLCPSGALGDNPDRPELRFTEDACLQCGICQTICPEQAITLEPRLDLRPSALSPRILNEEDPYACVSCGAPFGVRSTVEKIIEKLAGKHGMFSNPAAIEMIRMCDNCRIQAQYHQDQSAFARGPRPRIRTTDDYLLGSGDDEDDTLH